MQIAIGVLVAGGATFMLLRTIVEAWLSAKRTMRRAEATNVRTAHLTQATGQNSHCPTCLEASRRAHPDLELVPLAPPQPCAAHAPGAAPAAAPAASATAGAPTDVTTLPTAPLPTLPPLETVVARGTFCPQCLYEMRRTWPTIEPAPQLVPLLCPRHRDGSVLVGQAKRPYLPNLPTTQHTQPEQPPDRLGDRGYLTIRVVVPRRACGLWN